MDSEHVCVKPSARQNKLAAGTEHVCRGCETRWIVADDRRWVRAVGLQTADDA